MNDFVKALVVVAFLLTFVCLVINIAWLNNRVYEQQRQIDQLYYVVPSLIQRAVPEDQIKFYDYDKMPPGEYKMYFANHMMDNALVICLDPDPTKHREKGLRYFYISRIPKNVLNTWIIGEVRELSN